MRKKQTDQRDPIEQAINDQRDPIEQAINDQRDPWGTMSNKLIDQSDPNSKH